jgi:hypothetical protein
MSKESYLFKAVTGFALAATINSCGTKDIQKLRTESTFKTTTEQELCNDPVIKSQIKLVTNAGDEIETNIIDVNKFKNGSYSYNKERGFFAPEGGYIVDIRKPYSTQEKVDILVIEKNYVNTHTAKEQIPDDSMKNISCSIPIVE